MVYFPPLTRKNKKMKCYLASGPEPDIDGRWEMIIVAKDKRQARSFVRRELVSWGYEWLVEDTDIEFLSKLDTTPTLVRISGLDNRVENMEWSKRMAAVQREVCECTGGRHNWGDDGCELYCRGCGASFLGD